MSSSSEKAICWCTTCRGATVSRRTVWNHRDRPRCPQQPEQYSVRNFLSQFNDLDDVEEPIVQDDDVNDGNSGQIGSGSRKRARLLSDSDEDDTTPRRSREHSMDLTLDINHAPNFPEHSVDETVDVRNSSDNEHDLNPASQTHEPAQGEPDDNGSHNLDDAADDQYQDELDDGGIAAAALAHAQAMLNALNNIPDQLENNDAEPMPQAHLDSLRICQEYINLIKSATLDNGKLDAETVERLRNPTPGPVNINSPDDRLSIEIFTATDASEATYARCRDAIKRRYPENDILTFHNVKKLVAEASGVVPVMDDMCINSCIAFTGPFEDLDKCYICSAPRYDPHQALEHGRNIPCQQACTIPVGPQIQALRRSNEGAEEMLYMSTKIKGVQEMLDNLVNDEDMVYDDIFCGSDFVQFAESINITDKDTMLSFSVDGVQLYQDKKSDTWIAIWRIENYSPDLRFKQRKIRPSTFIPGPNKPKIIESFLFRALHHFSALQRENGGQGLVVWDWHSQATINTRILFALGSADAVGMTELDGRVGHHGAQGCRLGCKMKGRHKPHSGHYFAAHLQPNNYTVEDCNHPDVDIRDLEPSSVESYVESLRQLLGSRDQAAFERNRKATGLSRPSIFSGLVPELMLPVPCCFPLDLMHLFCLNIPDLLISLWRGTIKHSNDDNWEWAVLTGDVWTAHGKLVESATRNFPSSFHRPPRNPAEKISSGYKATEWFLYIFGLGPGFFRKLLPRPYWRNFCKLVAGVRIFVQRRLTGSQIADGHSWIIQFIEEYEQLYYKRRVDRLQVCRPSVHTPIHLAYEAMRTGPGAYYSQFTMERTIGDLGKEIRQPSNPFANLAQRGVLRCQINALVALCPDLEPIIRKSRQPPPPPPPGHPHLLHRRDRRPQTLRNHAEHNILMDTFGIEVVRRYGRVHLPNGQIARSTFNDDGRTRENRISHNVKIKLDGDVTYAEVRFYFWISANEGVIDHEVDDEDNDKVPWALVSVYSNPDQDILTDSFNTIWACRNTGDAGLKAIPASQIISLVSMHLLPVFDNEPDNLWFVVEKSSLEEAQLGEVNE